MVFFHPTPHTSMSMSSGAFMVVTICPKRSVEKLNHGTSGFTAEASNFERILWAATTRAPGLWSGSLGSFGTRVKCITSEISVWMIPMRVSASR